MHTLALFLTLLSASVTERTGTPCCEDPDGEVQPSVTAVRFELPVVVDGRLDDAAWSAAPVISGFRQREPEEGAAATEPTEVRIVYDDDALYVGARMYDSAPDSIVARLARRDADVETDLFVFFIDPYLDKRSGYYFAVSPAGTLFDGVLMNDDWNDNTWDGVWTAKAEVDGEGWTAEMRIPYSQLRFYRKDRYVWGVNFKRDIARKNEEDYLVFTPRNGSGFVSRFVELTGVERIRPARQVEVRPYVTTRAAYTHPDAANPFSDGSQYTPGVGGDVKVGLTSNLTLDATINPDFGQVEVDPAVVNLSAFETFYEERRPFFIEGASVFNFGYGGSRAHWGFNWGSPNLFYTRRIGRVPQGVLPDNQFSDFPEATRILGAAKVTGKLGRGWSVGAVSALTGRESARYQDSTGSYRAEVEPLAYYGVARGLKEIDKGRQGIGFMTTLSARSLADSRVRDDVNGSAYVAGLDGWTFLDKDKKYVITGWGAFSNVRGSENRLTTLQEGPLHYFQRPDADHVEMDTTRTSLSGFAGRVLFNKQSGRVMLNTALGVISPGFDATDLGFQFRSDVVNGHFGLGYRWTEPGRFTRNAAVIGAVFRSVNFSGETIWTGVWGLVEVQFPNYYNLFVNAAANPQTVNPSRTRGGPLTLNRPGYEFNADFGTDNRKRWVLGFETGGYFSEQGTNRYFGTNLRLKPASNVEFSFGPSLQLNDEVAWVGNFDDATATHTSGARYVFADLDQVELAGNLRLNWTFTPELSLQLFAQPLISSGDYGSYRELARPRSFDFTPYGEGQIGQEGEEYQVDVDGAGPAAAFTFDNPDFNFKSLRGNAVLRWEYRPGSTLFLVWTQARSQSDEFGDFRFNEAMGRLWDVRPDNVFMVKLSYWLGR